MAGEPTRPDATLVAHTGTVPSDPREFIDSIIEAFAGHDSVQTPLEDAQTVAMALGWAVRLCRTTEATILLYDHGFGVEGAPLVRSIIEHAFRLQWLVQEGQAALDLIEHQHRRHQRLLVEDVTKTDWGQAIVQEREDELPPTDLDLEKPTEIAVRSFEALLKRLGQAEWYLAYRLESAQSHPTYHSAEAYVLPVAAEGGIPQFSSTPTKDPTPIGVVLAMLVIGLGALGEIAEMSQELTEAVNEASEWLVANA